jgi:hypothetical protein
MLNHANINIYRTGEAHSGKHANGSGHRKNNTNVSRQRRICSNAKRQKKSHHTDYRMRGDWTEDDFHHSETEMVAHVGAFIKQHRRMPRIEEVTALFGSLQFDDMEPHSGGERDLNWDKMQDSYLRFISEIKTKNAASDQVINLLEDIFATFWLLGKCKSTADVVMLLMLFAKATFRPSESFTTKLRTFITEGLTEEEKPDDTDLPKQEAQSGWDASNIINAWRKGMQHPLFEKLSFVISFLVTVGFVKEKLFTIGSFKLFKAEAFTASTHCHDIVDGMLSTILFFFEKGYACFTSGSWHPLWDATSEMNKFDDDLAFLVANISNVKNGNLFMRTKMTDNKYLEILEKCRATVKQLIGSAPNSTMKAMMLQKRVTLDKLYTDYANFIASSGLREAPYCFCLYGKSSVGKSTLCPTILTALLKVNGFEHTDEFICNIQDTDKYMSTYKTHMTGVVLDDMCNTKPANATVNPTARIIEIMNNVRVYANMAEADRKGSTFVQPKIVAVTTNSTTLDAGFWSVEPVSVLRRINCRIVVSVKPQYATNGKLDSNKVALAFPGEEEEVIKDLWNLDVQYLEPSAPSNGDNSAENWRWRTFVHEGRELLNINVFELLKFLCPITQQHFINQRKIVEQYTNFGTKFDICDKCFCVNKRCTCVEEIPKKEPHSVAIMEMVTLTFAQYVISLSFRIGKGLLSELRNAVFPSAMEMRAIEQMSTKQLVLAARRCAYSPFAWWARLIPDEIVRTQEFTYFYFWMFRRRIMKDALKIWVITTIILMLFLVLLCDSYADIKFVCFYFLCPIALVNICISYAQSHLKISEELARRREAYDVYRMSAKSVSTLGKVVKVGAIATTGAIVFYGLRAVWREIARQWNTDPQATINPKTDADVRERNDTVNPWMQRVNSRPVNIGTCGTMTAKDLQSRVERANLVYLSYRDGLEAPRYGTNGIYVKSNIIMMPYHVWFEDSDLRNRPRQSLYFDIVRAEENANGGWKARDIVVHYSNVVRIPDQDLVLAYVASGGIRADIVPCFPIEPLTAPIGALCSYRHKDGSIVRFNADFTPCPADYFNPYGTIVRIPGGIARYNVDTFRGMCMTPLFAEHFPTCIIGFHLAGSTGKPTGSVGSVTRGQLETALVTLRTTPGYVEAHSSGEVPTHVLGKSIQFSPHIDIKSPVCYMDYYNADVYGSCGGGTSPTTKVIPSMISPILTREFGFEQKWAGPQYRPGGKKYKPWYDTLVHLVEPRHKLDPELLDLARKDYVNGFLPYFSMESLVEQLGPLTMVQNVNGKQGVKFIDGLNLSTSMGFPMTGPKSDYIVDMYPEPDGNGQMIRHFRPELELEKEMAKCEETYLKFSRCHHIFKACLKDEATKITKEKVRVFEAAPILLQLLIRKYYLPVIRFMSMVPVVSECAVGINCYGTEWSELHDHVTYFGGDRILAGDYAKWDLRLPAQLVMIAFDVMIRIARLSGKYSEDDLTIMRGIATDVSYPVIAYNGTLIELHGSNPSGQNLTAHLNSVCNSILLRMGFFHLTGIKACFQQYVHAFTYGDDLISGVHESVPQFTHITYAKFLEEMDIEFTMPDKTSKPVAYLNIVDTDFLKRKSHFHNDFMRYVGKLDLDSINKSLMNQRKTNKDMQKQAMRSTIQSATHELVLHGEDVYNQYCECLRVATSELGMVLPELDVPYVERVANWHMKYAPDGVGYEFLPNRIQDAILKIKATGEVPVVGSMPDYVPFDLEL